MKRINPFYLQTLCLNQTSLREQHLLFYLTIAVTAKKTELTTDVFAMMTGQNQLGITYTLLFHKSGLIEKTTDSPQTLYQALGLKHGVTNTKLLRQVLNFSLDKHPQLPAFIIPDRVFSRLKVNLWISLNDAVSYQSLVTKHDHKSGSLISFACGATFEVDIGIRSVRHTFLVDVIETWAFQLNHLLGAQPLTEAEGVINPRNPFMTKKIATLNNKIAAGKSRQHTQKIVVPKICPLDFTNCFFVFLTILPMNAEGYIRESDIKTHYRAFSFLFNQILKWQKKSQGHNDNRRKKKN